MKEAFASLGWSVTLLQYGPANDPSPSTKLYRLFDRDSYYEEACAKEFNKTLRMDLRQLMEGVDVDALLFLKGHRLDPDNKSLLQRTRCSKVAWAIDSLERAPAQKEIFEFCDLVFVIDGWDAECFHPSAQWLPLGVDEHIYRPRKNKNLDVLAIGTLGPRYLYRQHQVLNLCRSNPLQSWKIGFIGSTGNRISDWRLSLGFRAKWIAPRLPESELATQIASARICVNILQDDGRRPVNPAFFSIAAAGTCQVVDGRPYLAEWLRPYDDYIPFQEGGLVNTIEALLNDQPMVERVALTGHLKVTSAHTFVCRARGILTQLESRGHGADKGQR